MARELNLFLVLSFLAMSLGWAAAPQDVRPPLSTDEVLDLLTSSTSGKVIVATIQKYGIAFDPTPQVLEAFRKAGANEAVLSALREAWHQETPKPLGDKEIKEMLYENVPSESIVNEIRERGIDFQPTPGYFEALRADGAKEGLIEMLRTTSPRAFTKDELLRLLARRVDQNWIAQKIRQRGIDFEPGNTNLQALRNAGARAPLVNAVRTARRGKPFVAQAAANSPLASLLERGQPATLLCSPIDSDVPVFAEPDNLGKVAARLRCGDRVTFLEPVAVPPGVDKIQYADGKEGFVADAYLQVPIATPGGDVSMPTAIYKPDPKYTPQAEHDGIEGTVKFLIVIDAQGNVSDIQETSPPLGGGLDKSAMDTVRKWKFIPAKRHGVPVPVRVGTEVTFRTSTKPH